MPYQFPTSDIINITDTTNPGFEAEVTKVLSAHGLSFQKVNDMIVIPSMGVPGADHSVTIIIDLVEFDGHGMLLLQAKLAEYSDDVQGMIAVTNTTKYARFGSVQVRPKNDGTSAVWLSYCLYQDHLSGDELAASLLLLAKEADVFDTVMQKFIAGEL